MVLLELMLNQGEEWREFDEDIRERRESVRRERDPNEEVLAATVLPRWTSSTSCGEATSLGHSSVR